MATMRPWVDELAEHGDGHASACKVTDERRAIIGAQLTAIEGEESDLVRELNDPGFRERRHHAAAVALADGVELEDAESDVRGRLKEIAERKPALKAALVVLDERFSSAYGEARNELVKELRPRYVELLGGMVSAVVDLLVAAQAEAEFRLPLRMQDISFSGGLLQGFPLAGTQPDGSIVLWLRKVAASYPELKISRLCAKRGVEI